MKKRTKKQLFQDYADAVKAIKEDKSVKRHGAKDGSISTYPTIPGGLFCEASVLKQCLGWLKKHRILANRNNVGSGKIGESGYYSYGIRGAGDILGLTKLGVHFEIEVKRGKGGRLSLNQQKRMKNIRENNGIYLVIHSIEELEFYFAGLI